MIPYCSTEIVKDEYDIIFLFFASSFKLQGQTLSHLAQSTWRPSRSYFVTLVLTLLRLECVVTGTLANDWGRVLPNLFAAFANAKIYYGRIISSPISQSLSLYEKNPFIALEQETISGL
tara:strand:- start:449 stop:805 length:357 start_codon:yes stop_codon:yes gene_type:complete